VALPSLSVKGRALRYLAQREHSRAELERKLARHVEDRPEAPASQQIQSALDALAAAGLLSDRRAADAVVDARAARFGDRKLRHTLRSRGVDEEAIAQAMTSVQGTEVERALGVWRRRFGQPAQDAAGRAKQARFLAGRGFSADCIRKILRGLDDDV